MCRSTSTSTGTFTPSPPSPRALETHPGSVAVVGTRGQGGFSGLRVGRVPLQLVDHAGAAVIVVPHATGDDAAGSQASG